MMSLRTIHHQVATRHQDGEHHSDRAMRRACLQNEMLFLVTIALVHTPKILMVLLWHNGGHIVLWYHRNHRPMNGIPLPPNQRPITPRLMSNQTGSSFVSSFGPGIRPPLDPLRSQFSSTKLTSVYNGSRRGAPHLNSPPLYTSPTIDRAALVSQPRMCRRLCLLLPTATPWTARPNVSTLEGKRGSGSSQSTGESSDYSPNSSSPITPFGSSESSLGGMGTLRPSRSQTFENALPVQMPPDAILMLQSR
jgi:hypothetical protein